MTEEVWNRLERLSVVSSRSDVKGEDYNDFDVS